MQVSSSFDAVDLDKPAFEAQAERPDQPVRVRVQPTLLRLRAGETTANHRSWTGVSWTIDCRTAEEALAVRDALDAFFGALGRLGPAGLTPILTAAQPTR